MTQEEQFTKMTKTPIPTLITKLAIPTIVSMLISAIYNMADTFFVSQLGTSAAGAVGIVFSLMAIIQAIGFTLGMGSGSLISRLLGEQDYEKANSVASSGLISAVILGLFITFVGLFTLHPLLHLLGATPTIFPFSVDYSKFILLGAPIMMSSFVLNNILRSEGKATLAMIGLTIGGILNIALDPIFIFVLNLGISGAAIATLLSQFIGCCILFGCFFINKTTIRLHPKNISRHKDIYVSILTTGCPSFCRQGLASVSTAALNINAAIYGDAAVAAMSIVGRIFFLVFSIILGFGQGFQPVVGYNWGAKNYNRVREAIIFSLKTGMILMGLLSIIGFIMAPQLITLFRRGDPAVISIGNFAMRAQCITMVLIPLWTISNMTFQVLGKSRKASVLSAARQGIFFLPLIIILPRIIGLKGVQLTQPIADILTFILSAYYIIPFIKELSKNSK